MRKSLALTAVALGIVLSGCGTNRATSVPNGKAEPGAGGGSRGGANDGNAAGETGRASNPGGKYNNGPTENSKRTEAPKN